MVPIHYPPTVTISKESDKLVIVRKQEMPMPHPDKFCGWGCVILIVVGLTGFVLSMLHFLGGEHVTEEITIAVAVGMSSFLLAVIILAIRDQRRSKKTVWTEDNAALSEKTNNDIIITFDADKFVVQHLRNSYNVFLPPGCQARSAPIRLFGLLFDGF